MGKFLDGKKTYLGMIALGILGLLLASDVIDQDTWIALTAIVGALTGVAARSGSKKAENAAKQAAHAAENAVRRIDAK